MKKIKLKIIAAFALSMLIPSLHNNMKASVLSSAAYYAQQRQGQKLIDSRTGMSYWHRGSGSTNFSNGFRIESFSNTNSYIDVVATVGYANFHAQTIDGSFMKTGPSGIQTVKPSKTYLGDTYVNGSRVSRYRYRFPINFRTNGSGTYIRLESRLNSGSRSARAYIELGVDTKRPLDFTYVVVKIRSYAKYNQLLDWRQGGYNTAIVHGDKNGWNQKFVMRGYGDEFIFNAHASPDNVSNHRLSIVDSWGVNKNNVGFMRSNASLGARDDWKLIHLGYHQGNPLVQIQNIHDGKVLDITGSNYNNHTRFGTYWNNGTNNQKFILEAVGYGS